MPPRSRLDASLAAVALLATAGSAMARQAQAWSNTDEARALVSEMMSDAEARSSLLEAAGHDGKFFLASADGNFRLNVSGYAQFRYYLNFRDDAHADPATPAEDDFESGFQARRTRLDFNGHVYDPHLTYRVQANFDRRGSGELQVVDAYVGYKWDNGWSAQWGQFKLPFLREELISASMQLAVDRSLVNQVFSGVRAQAVQAACTQEGWRILAAFSDGFRSINSDFASRRIQSRGFLTSGESDYAFTARAELKPAGAWDRFKDFTSTPGSGFAALIGVAGHVEGGDRTASAFSAGSFTYASWTADLSLEGDGWNVFIAGVGAYSRFNDVTPGGNDARNDDYGVVAQGGFFIPGTDWEPYARFDATFADASARGLPSGEDSFSTVTVGVNCYLHGHAAKFTFDTAWYLDASNALSGRNTALGYLGSDNRNEVALRFQFQLMF